MSATTGAPKVGSQNAVRVRTDGARVLVVTESADSNVKEAYAFLVDNSGNVTEDELR